MKVNKNILQFGSVTVVALLVTMFAAKANRPADFYKDCNLIQGLLVDAQERDVDVLEKGLRFSLTAAKTTDALTSLTFIKEHLATAVGKDVQKQDDIFTNVNEELMQLGETVCSQGTN
jgi:hypothetical protein